MRWNTREIRRGFKSECRWNLFFNAKVFAANSTAWHLRIAERWRTTTFKTSFPLCFSCSRRLPKVKREKTRKNFQFRRSMSSDNGWQMGRTEEEENEVGERQTKKLRKFSRPKFFLSLKWWFLECDWRCLAGQHWVARPGSREIFHNAWHFDEWMPSVSREHSRQHRWWLAGRKPANWIQYVNNWRNENKLVCFAKVE